MEALREQLKKEMEALNKRIDELNEEKMKKGQELLNFEFKNLFADFPDMDSFGWRQYTPYFNDGDECVFSAHIDQHSITINGADHYDDDTLDCHEEASKKISDLLEMIGEDTLREIYGDHVEITVKSDGEVITDEYSHD